MWVIENTLVTAILLAMVLALVGCREAHQNKIAFTRNTEGQQEIYVMNPDGRDQTRLTNGPVDAARPWLVVGNWQPSWSPDGTRIVFVSNRDASRNEPTVGQLYVMNSDGTQLVRLTRNDRDDLAPDWSPDGTRIAFARGDWEQSSIYLINADGSREIQLTTGPAQDRAPTWSPNGKKIAFTRVTGGSGEIWLMDVNGSNQTRLTQAVAQPDWPGGHPSDSQPRWSPTGNEIAFVRTTGGDILDPAIYLMNTSGSDQRRLVGEEGRCSDVAWSPEGSRIVYARKDGGLHVIRADGTQCKRLTKTSALDLHPDWWGPALSTLNARGPS